MPDAELDLLLNLASFRNSRSSIRALGNLNLLLGIFTAWLGLSCIDYSTPQVVQAVAGIVIILVSLWAIVRPSLRVFAVFMILVLGSGLWNIWLSVFYASPSLSLVPLILGGLQLWGVRGAYQTYKEWQRLDLKPPTPDVKERYKRITDAVRNADPRLDDDVIELKIGSRRLRGWLLDDRAFLAFRWGKQLVPTRSADFLLTPLVKRVQNQKGFNLRIQANGATYYGSCPRWSFDRYAEWKQQRHPQEAPEALGLLGTGKTNWLPFHYLPMWARVLFTLFGLAMILMTLFLIITVIQYS